MNSLALSDFPAYTDVYTRHCPHCGIRFYTDRRLNVFHNQSCYRQHYSLIQRNPVAALMATFNFPSQRAWSLYANEKLHDYFYNLLGTKEYTKEIQDFPLIKQYRDIHGIKPVRENEKKSGQLEIFVPSKEFLEEMIVSDLKEILDYPPAFEKNDQSNRDFILGLLLIC